jgi:hypothetical protein
VLLQPLVVALEHLLVVVVCLVRRRLLRVQEVSLEPVRQVEGSLVPAVAVALERLLLGDYMELQLLPVDSLELQLLSGDCMERLSSSSNNSSSNPHKQPCRRTWTLRRDKNKNASQLPFKS